MAGFEPTTSWIRTRRATRLRHIPSVVLMNDGTSESAGQESNLQCAETPWGYRPLPLQGVLRIVGMVGFEPTTSSLPVRRAPRLRYIPNVELSRRIIEGVGMAGLEPATS